MQNVSVTRLAARMAPSWTIFFECFIDEATDPMKIWTCFTAVSKQGLVINAVFTTAAEYVGRGLKIYSVRR